MAATARSVVLAREREGRGRAQLRARGPGGLRGDAAGSRGAGREAGGGRARDRMRRAHAPILLARGEGRLALASRLGRHRARPASGPGKSR